jgi:hypothetical protein
MNAAAPVLLALLLGISAQPARAVSSPSTTATLNVKTIVGQIVSVDPVKGTITIGESVQASRPKTPKLKEIVTLSIDGSTELFRGKRPATKDELKPRDHVVVRYVLTPQGARALSCRVSDLVTRTPPPTAAPATTASGAGTGASGGH